MTLPAIVFTVVAVSLIVFTALVAIQATMDIPPRSQTAVRRLRKRNAMRELRLEERRRHRRAVRRIRRSN